MDSFFLWLKTVCIVKNVYRNRVPVSVHVFVYSKCKYNRARHHSPLVL